MFRIPPQILFFAALFSIGLAAQSPNDTVLIVYNSSDTDSTAVAIYYAGKRSIPVANLCGVAFPDKGVLPWPSWTTSVKGAIRGCLDAVGRTKILYIVLSYNTPFRLLNAENTNYNAPDQHIADIWDQAAPAAFSQYPQGSGHGYYAPNQSQGNAFLPYLPLVTWRGKPKSQTIYSVWRLDAPTPELAKGLVDKAMAAEAAGGPTGQACLDPIVDNSIVFLPDAGTRSGDWSLYRAAEFATRAGIPVTQELTTYEFGSPALCPSAILYSGWYSYDHCNDAFTWNQGAIGFHMDSYSAGNPRSGSNWSVNAILHGITITSGAMNEPYIEGLPKAAGIFRNLFEGANVGDAFLRNTRRLKWMILNFGDPLYRPFPNGRSPFNPPPLENYFRLSSPFTVGGKSVTATLTLASPAPSGGMVFTLSSDDPTAATVPPSLTVPQGATSRTFTVTAMIVPDWRAPILTATSGALTLRNTLEVDPMLADLVANPGSATSNQNVTFTVLLNAAAPKKGVVVQLISKNPAIVLPASVTVPSGQTSASVMVKAGVVSSVTTGDIAARNSGATVSLTYTVSP